MKRLILSVLSVLALGAGAQTIPPERPRARPPSELTGWAEWEKAAEIWKRVKVPPAPPLTPAEAMKTFRLAPGFRLELFAAEPLVANPIFFEFDPDGRLWAVEYRGYMRDLEGRGEGDPLCRLVVLEDTDEDGRADKSTPFLDGLVMPRSFAFVKGGVLVAEPPRLWFCEDTDGDRRCDRKTPVGTYGRAGNPQHTANGLRYGPDNWLHNADWPKRHRFGDGKLIEEETIHRGQFGVTFDDFGRYFTCSESQPLYADFLPAEYLLRNRHFLKAFQRGGRDRGEFGVAVNIGQGAREVFPIRPTPQITLGALELRDDGRLRTYTVVAGSCFYHGHQFPDDAYGNVFVPEAGGHLLGRLKLHGEMELKTERFYPAEQELLASTDERFRPVNARVGPDGALYVADMYHGIIEHVIFLAPYLNEQIKARDLESGNDMGRIWRIVSERKAIDRRRPRLSAASAADLVARLAHPNGWHRLTAQRLLVERGDKTAVPALRQLAVSGSGTAPAPTLPDTNALARLHALWTLDGLGALDWRSALAASDDAHPYVRATAARLCESLLTQRAGGLSPTATNDLLSRLAALSVDASELVRLHALLALGSLRTDAAETLVARCLGQNPRPLFRSAALTGLGGRELEFLERLLADPAWQTNSSHARRTFDLLAQCVTDEGQPARLAKLLDHAAAQTGAPAWRRDAILAGILATAPGDFTKHKPIALEREPALLASLSGAGDAATRQRALKLRQLFTWPGADPTRAAVNLAPLTPEQKRLAELGQQHFAATCAQCHQPHGGGLPGTAPPLAGSEWVHGPAERLARVVLHGLYGPLEVSGQSWNHHMPGFASALDDEPIAGLLTYVRRAWGNTADPIAPELVAAVRRATAGRELPWSAAELAALEGRADGAEAEAKLPPLITADARGELQLHARLAATHGRELAYRPALDILAPWRQEHDVAEWRVASPRGGAYEAFVLLAADDASAGDRFRLETEGGALEGAVASTGGYDRFREFAVGKIPLRPGTNRVLLRPAGRLRAELADVRALRLRPVDQTQSTP
jgi:mono/diheme cytochrome c family protein/glucose/arabinose dehydrogenase